MDLSLLITSGYAVSARYNNPFATATLHNKQNGQVFFLGTPNVSLITRCFIPLIYQLYYALKFRSDIITFWIPGFFLVFPIIVV